MTGGLIDVGTTDGIRTITFDRPAVHNSFNAAMVEEIADAVASTGDDEQVRVLVFRGNGRSFSSGADLEEMRHNDSVSVRAVTRRWIRLFELVETIPQPVVASVHGYAIGGGTELTLACDLVVAARSARFGLTEARVGVIPGAGASVRLARWVPRAMAKEILMLGEPFDAELAQRIGLVNRLVDDDELVAATDDLARSLASRSPLALAAAKRAVNVGGELELRDGIEFALDQFAQLFDGPDQKEGMTAFLEKRAPRFTGGLGSQEGTP